MSMLIVANASRLSRCTASRAHRRAPELHVTGRRIVMPKRSVKETAGRKKAAKRELIDTGTDKRFVRRATRGQFKESDDVGKSLTVDRRKSAETRVKSGQGDKGDQGSR
jgi:hypothetical protein